MNKNVKSINDYYKDSNGKLKKSRGDFFILTTVSVIDDKEYRKAFKGVRTTYDWMRANVVRSEFRNDKYNIKERYYDKGKLAVSKSFRQLADELFIHYNTAQSHIDKLVKSGAVKKYKLPGSQAKGRYEQNVYVLGSWKSYTDPETGKKRYMEFYYIDDKYGAHQTTMFR
jgi:hypothetical protein